jgi:hypothetical protein
MYADDIVLIANNEKELQNMIDIVVNYSHKWRFELNHKKTEIVIFGRKTTDYHFHLRAYNGVEMKELMVVPEYTYLGVIFKQNRSWNDFKSKAIGKARRCMAMTWGMGIHVGGLSAKAAINAWKALIRPVLEYGAEVIQYSKNASGSWPEADQIQMQMGRRILGCHPRTANAAVKGDLGWQSLKARRDMLRLRYWGKLVSMNSKRWTRRIYDKSREEYTENGQSNWCTYTHQLLKDLGLEASWNNNCVGTMQEWNAKVNAAIKDKEIQRWKDEMQSKPKLRSYMKLKQTLDVEDYVISNRMSRGRRLLTDIRSGSNKLRIETGRHYTPSIPVEERICWCCGEGVEDEQHFVTQCREYQQERVEMFQAISEVTEGRFRAHSLLHTQPERLFNLLVGSGVQDKRAEVMKCVEVFLVRAFNKRQDFCQQAGIV